MNYTVRLPSSLIRVGVSRPCSNLPFFATFLPPLTRLVKVRTSQLRIQTPIQMIFPTPILKLKSRLQWLKKCKNVRLYENSDFLNILHVTYFHPLLIVVKIKNLKISPLRIKNIVEISFYFEVINLGNRTGEGKSSLKDMF